MNAGSVVKDMTLNRANVIPNGLRVGRVGAQDRPDHFKPDLQANPFPLFRQRNGGKLGPQRRLQWMPPGKLDRPLPLF
jgi:hypothetical protein